MLKNKMIWLVIGLLFGICLSMPLKGAGDVVVGFNHWTRDTGDTEVYPTNAGDDISLENGSLLWADLSGYMGIGVEWDSENFVINATGDTTGMGDPFFNASDAFDYSTEYADDWNASNSNDDFFNASDPFGMTWEMTQQWNVSDNNVTKIGNSNGNYWEANTTIGGYNTIQLAIWDLNGTGGTVWLPQSIMTISLELYFDAISNITIQGAGRNVSIIRQITNAEAGFAIGNSSDIIIKDLTMQGPNPGSRTDGAGFSNRADGIILFNCKDCKVINCNVYEFGGDGIDSWECTNLLIDGCKAKGNYDDGVAIYDAVRSSVLSCVSIGNTQANFYIRGTDIAVRDYYSYGGSPGVLISGTDGIIIDGISKNSVTQGVQVGAAIDNLVLTGIITNSGGHGLYINADLENFIMDLVCEGIDEGGITFTGGATVKNGIINAVSQNNQKGIWDATGIDNVQITGLYSDNTDEGILLTGSKGCIISAVIQGNGDEGIKEATGADRNLITGCNFTGNSAPVLLTGSYTIVKDNQGFDNSTYEYIPCGSATVLYPSPSDGATFFNDGNNTLAVYHSSRWWYYLAGITGAGLWNDDGNTLFTSTDGRNIQANGTITGEVFSDTSMTNGSILFSDGINFTEDNSNFFWNNSINRLGIGINTGFDPRSGFTVIGDLDIIHTATEMDDHALELDVDAAGFGDVKALYIDYITGAIVAGQDEGILLINIDEILATGGDVFAIEVLATNGSAGIYGLKTGVGVGPIHQDSGTFANPTTGTDNTPSTNVSAMIDGDIGTTTAIFENDNEYIIIGAAAAFEEMEFILTTESSNPGIKPTFWYSTSGAGAFTQFTPVDGTNGFRHTGVVAWDASDLVGHTTNDDTDTYDIKVIRTQNNIGTEPVLGYAKTAATTEYIWDENGDLTINTVDTGQGANELYDMDQNVLTTSDVVFDTVNGSNGDFSFLDVGNDVNVSGDLTVDTDTLVVNVDSYEDRVGIGTSTPSEMLSIYGGDVMVSGSTNPEYKMYATLAGAHNWSFFGSGGSFNIRDIDTARNIFSINNNSLASSIIIAPTATLLNAPRADLDFRISGDNYLNLLFCNAGLDRVGINTSNPSYELDVEGDIECTVLHETSDERVKDFVMELPVNQVKRFCENVSVWLFYWRDYNYSYEFEDDDNITGNITGINIGDVDVNKLDVGIPAQHLYSYLMNFSINETLNQRLANNLVLSPDNESIQLWNVNYRAVSMIFAKYTQILAEELEENNVMTGKLARWASSLPEPYRFHPDDW